MADKSTTVLKRLIEAELYRLGVQASETNVTGFVVNDQDELPQGWVQVADDYESWYGPAGEILESLEGALAGETIAESDTIPPYDDHPGILAVYEALEPYAGRNPQDADAWRDAHEFTGIEVEDLGLIVLRTNGGLKWGFAPTGTDYSAYNSTHDFSQQYDRADEALDAARDFIARQKAGESA